MIKLHLRIWDEADNITWFRINITIIAFVRYEISKIDARKKMIIRKKNQKHKKRKKKGKTEKPEKCFF